jgi:hypothetical protein
MLSFFKTKPLLDETSEAWLLDTFAWLYHEFDGPAWLTQARIVLPTGEFFPEQVNSVDGMAQYVFEQVKRYAGLSVWPVFLAPQKALQQQHIPKISFAGEKRGERSQLVATTGELYMSYNPQQINQPQDLIASYAQSLAYICVMEHGKATPGGEHLMPHTIELLANYFGFGVMLANTAYQFKRGCGSCYNPYANREAKLGEAEQIYALALMTRLTQTDPSKVKANLKPHLKSMFKQGLAQVDNIKKHSADPLMLSLLEKA